jgi:hypothetical protein
MSSVRTLSFRCFFFRTVYTTTIISQHKNTITKLIISIRWFCRLKIHIMWWRRRNCLSTIVGIILITGSCKIWDRNCSVSNVILRAGLPLPFQSVTWWNVRLDQSCSLNFMQHNIFKKIWYYRNNTLASYLKHLKMFLCLLCELYHFDVSKPIWCMLPVLKQLIWLTNPRVFLLVEVVAVNVLCP